MTVPFLCSSIALFLALLFQPAAPFSARWDGPTRAILTFTIQSRACLARQPLNGAGVALDCYDRPGDYRITLGGSQTDGNVRPRVGDVYVLSTNGATRRARLVSVVYVASVRR